MSPLRTLPWPRLALAAILAIMLVGQFLLASASSAEDVTSQVRDGHGLLTVNASPDVATQISVAGEVRNTSTIKGLELPEGGHLVCFDAPAGYLAPPCQQADVRAGELTTLTGQFEAAGEVEVVVAGSDVQLEVAIDGIVRDRTPLRVPAVVGEIEVCVTAPTGYEPLPCERVLVAAGERAEVVFAPEASLPEEPSPDPDATPDPDPEPDQPTDVGDENGPTAIITRAVHYKERGPHWGARVTLQTRDAEGTPTTQVPVVGRWSTGVTQTCTTGDATVCTLTEPEIHNRVKEVRFDIESVDGVPVDGPYVLFAP